MKLALNEEFKKIVAIADNHVHFIRTTYRAGGNDVSVLIMLPPDRISGYVLATTAYPIPEELRASAHDLARLSCAASLPEVIFDSETGGCAAVMPLHVQAVFAGELPLDGHIQVAAERVVAVCRRIELHAEGMSMFGVALISDEDLARWRTPFRLFEPFDEYDMEFDPPPSQAEEELE